MKYAKGGLLKGDVEDYVPEKGELIIPMTIAKRVFKEVSKMYPQFTRWEEEVTKRIIMEKVEAERKKTMEKTRFIMQKIEVSLHRESTTGDWE